EVAVSAFRTLFWLITASFAIALLAFMMMEERPLKTSNDDRMG
ncbi:MAG: hypothetical protein JWN93_1558, partial [Hyphomicrobiales bacterium]|nr:hypothetical protein [Hyphomicrobiales bacterium]